MKTQVPVVMGHARSFTFWSCLLPSFSAPLLFPYFTCIAMLFYHLVPSTWHPASSLSNKYSSLILEVSSQTGWTWQSNLRPSSPPWQSNLTDNAQNVTPSHTPELLRRKLPPLLFHSHGYTLLFLSIFPLHSSESLCLSPTRARKPLKGRDQGPFDQFISCASSEDRTGSLSRM